MKHDVCYVMVYAWHDIKKPKHTEQLFSVIPVYLFVIWKHTIWKYLLEMNEPQPDPEFNFKNLEDLGLLILVNCILIKKYVLALICIKMWRGKNLCTLKKTKKKSKAIEYCLSSQSIDRFYEVLFREHLQRMHILVSKWAYGCIFVCFLLGTLCSIRAMHTSDNSVISSEK